MTSTDNFATRLVREQCEEAAAEQLGMAVGELREALAIAERVKGWHDNDLPVPVPTPFDGDDMGSQIFNEGIDHAARYFLNGDDQ